MVLCWPSRVEWKEGKVLPLILGGLLLLVKLKDVEGCCACFQHESALLFNRLRWIKGSKDALSECSRQG